ncbi:LacI family transcriptional regulator [Puniceicoccaceae bacterium K14]|nr:LacI family transcriptional regulator [Puniceicoccaceae bacterium K14]
MAKPNQKLIAEKLKLSRTTVSRCFTNHPKINPETRAKVFQLAAEMGFSYSQQRNSTGQREDSERNTIAVIVGIDRSVKDAVKTAGNVLKGISEKAANAGLEIEVHYINPADFNPQPRSRKIIKNVSCTNWKGVVLIYNFSEAAVTNVMAKFPTVSVLEDYQSIDVDCISQDQVRGISKLMEHLHDIGHHRIGFMSWKYEVRTPWVERRLGAYVENLFRFGIELDPNLIINLQKDENFSLSQLVDKVADRIQSGVTAWVCAADHQAYHLRNELEKRGIRVPEDCSITGYDGIEPPEGADQITTIRMPFKDMGHSAISSLIRKMGNPTAQRHNVQISGELLIDKSTAAPPQLASSV